MADNNKPAYSPSWIKVATSLFDDEKIVFIEDMEDADSILIIWIKLLCLAGKQNNGGVFTLGKIPYTVKMLSTIFRRDQDQVQKAIDIFEQFGMVEIINGTITLPNWGKHQNLDALEKKAEYMRSYMRDYRAKQRQQAQESLTVNPTKTENKDLCKTNGNSNSNANVSRTDIDIEGDRYIDIDIDKKDIVGKPDTPRPECIEIIDFLNEQTGQHYKPTTAATQKAINGRLAEGNTVEDFKTVIRSKVKEWLHDDKMRKYLTPDTLFRSSNFEKYLQAAQAQPPKTKTPEKYPGLSERVARESDANLQNDSDFDGSKFH